MKLPDPSKMQTVVPQDTQKVVSAKSPDVNVGIGNTLIAIGEQRRKEKRATDFDNASAYFTTEKGRLDQKYKLAVDDDGNRMNWETMGTDYDDALSEITQNALGMIDNAQDKAKFRNAKSTAIADGRETVAITSRGIEQDVAVESLYELMESTSDNVATSDSEVNLADNVMTLQQSAQKLVDQGFIKAQAVPELMAKWTQDTVNKRLQLLDGQQTLDFLNNPANKKYLDGINVKQYKDLATTEVNEAEASSWTQDFFASVTEQNEGDMRQRAYKKIDDIKDPKKQQAYQSAFEKRYKVEASNRAEADAQAYDTIFDFFSDTSRQDNLTADSFRNAEPELYNSMSTKAKQQIPAIHAGIYAKSSTTPVVEQMEKAFRDFVLNGDTSSQAVGAFNDLLDRNRVYLSIPDQRYYAKQLAGALTNMSKSTADVRDGDKLDRAIERVLEKPDVQTLLDITTVTLNKNRGQRIKDAISGAYADWQTEFIKQNQRRPSDVERNDIIRELAFGIDEQTLYERDEDARRDFIQSYIIGDEPEQVEFKRKLVELFKADPQIRERTSYLTKRGVVPEGFEFGAETEAEIAFLMNDPFLKVELNEHINEAYRHTQRWKESQPKETANWDALFNYLNRGVINPVTGEVER